MKNTNKLGIYTSPNFQEVGLEGTIAAIAKAGFKSTFCGWKEGIDYTERINLYDKYGIEIDNIHIFETQGTSFTLKASDFEKYGINHGAHKINIYAYHDVDGDKIYNSQ